MASINDFKGIPPLTWTFIVAMVIGTIIPGLLLVFLFRQDLFMEVETIKLLFLSMGITLPVWLCNTILVAYSLDDGNNKKGDEQVRNDIQIAGLVGAMFSVPALFIPVIVKMFCDISSEIAFYIGFGIELAIIILFVIIFNKNKKQY